MRPLGATERRRQRQQLAISIALRVGSACLTCTYVAALLWMVGKLPLFASDGDAQQQVGMDLRDFYQTNATAKEVQGG